MPEEEQAFFYQHSSVVNRLRRLQDLSRADVPAAITGRAGHSFTLQQEPMPQEVTREVAVVVYSQDPFVGKPEVRYMLADEIQPGLINSRIRAQTSKTPLAQPDAEGNYLYWPGTPQFPQVNSFYYVNFTLRMYEWYARRAIGWAFPAPRITVDPHVGNEPNAFYSEQDRLLGFHSFQGNGDLISTAESADIVSHEAGHAILDGLRDFYNESFGLGPSAFHESFGDISAVLVALHDDSLVRRVLEWTKGDMRVDNFIASVAEQMTNELLQQRREHVRGHTIYLRNALNGFKHMPFEDLAYAPADPQLELGREPHNYSRLFTGAFYEVLVGVYDRLKLKSPAHLALHKARDVMGDMLVCAIELGPLGEFDFGDMALAFLTADEVLYDGAYRNILLNVFCEVRGILPRSVAVNHLTRLHNLPDLRLPPMMNSALESGIYLEEKVIPALNLAKDSALTPLSSYRNGLGYAYVSYLSSRKVRLEGKEFKRFNGAEIDVYGGVTLLFDRDNRLRSACVRLVTEEDIRQIRLMMVDLIEQDRVATSSTTGAPPTTFPLYLQPDLPHGLLLESSSGGAKLVKYPVVFDEVPQPPPALEYLRAWGGVKHVE